MTLFFIYFLLFLGSGDYTFAQENAGAQGYQAPAEYIDMKSDTNPAPSKKDKKQWDKDGKRLNKLWGKRKLSPKEAAEMKNLQNRVLIQQDILKNLETLKDQNISIKNKLELGPRLEYAARLLRLGDTLSAFSTEDINTLLKETNTDTLDKKIKGPETKIKFHNDNEKDFVQRSSLEDKNQKIQYQAAPDAINDWLKAKEAGSQVILSENAGEENAGEDPGNVHSKKSLREGLIIGDHRVPSLLDIQRHEQILIVPTLFLKMHQSHLKDAREDVETYEKQLKDPSLSTPQKQSLSTSLESARKQVAYHTEEVETFTNQVEEKTKKLAALKDKKTLAENRKSERQHEAGTQETERR